MPIENFSGNPISSTYQRVVQTDGTYLADGTGSILNILNITASYALNASGSGGSSFPFTGSALITGSLGVTGSGRFTNDLYVDGTLFANTQVIVTQSYYSGSNIFGDELSDIQQFTGSVQMTGSLSVQGRTVLNGEVLMGLTNRSGTNILYYDIDNGEITQERIPGSTGQIFFNENDNFQTDSGLNWDNISKNLIVTGSLRVTGSITSSQDILVNSINIGRGGTSGSITSGWNIAIGENNFTTSSISLNRRNIAIGAEALRDLTTGYFNIAIGSAALKSNTNTEGNIGIGVDALLLNTGGNYNTSIGYRSMQSNIDGQTNTSIGFDSLKANISGDSNTAVGNAALSGNKFGRRNTAVGDGALGLLTQATGSNNTALGYSAGVLIYSGSYNTIVGSDATPFETGSNNTVLGGRLSSTSITSSKILNNSVIISDGVGSVRFYSPSSSNVLIGTFTDTGQKLQVSGSARITNGLLVTGSINLSGSFTSSQDIQVNFLDIGRGASTITSTFNVAIGKFNLTSNTVGSTNVVIGYNSLPANTEGNRNVAIGQNNMLANTTGNTNVAIGYESLRANTTGRRNIGIGLEAVANSTTGESNIGIGQSALGFHKTGSFNTAMGDYSLADLQNSGSYNAGFGWYSGAGLFSGSYNTFLGIETTLINSGSNNVIIGGRFAPSIFGTLPLGTSISDSVVIGTNSGSIRLYSPASTNILIGTLTDTGEKLQVSGSGKFSGNLTITGSATNSLLVKGSGTTFATTTLRVENANTSTSLVVLDNGNVGIGTTSPGAKLQIQGADSLLLLQGSGSTGHYFPRLTIRGAYPGVIFQSEDGGMTFGSFTTIQEYGANPYGNLAITSRTGLNFYIQSYSSGTPVMSFRDGNVQINIGSSIGAKLGIRGDGSTSSTTSLRVENSNASASLVVLDNGNTGIGLAAPAYKLDVNGNTRISGDLYMNDTTNRTIYGVNGTYINLYNGGTGGMDFYSLNGTAESRFFGALRVTGNLITQGAFSMNGNLDIGSNNSVLAVSNGIRIYRGFDASMQFYLGHPSVGDFVWDYPENTTLMVLKRTGNLGIGTSNPTQGKLVIAAPDESTASAISIRQSNDLNFGMDIGLDQTVNGNGYFYSVSGGSKYEFLQFSRTTTPNIFLVGSGGRVGIGTTTPNYILDVYQTNVKAQIRASGEDQSATLLFGTPFLGTSSPKTAIIAKGLSNWSRADLHFCLNTNQGSNAIEATIADSKMVILNEGNVGIGTTSPTAKLNIIGSGTTSATNALLVQNASSTNLATINDSGQLVLGTINSGSASDQLIICRNNGWSSIFLDAGLAGESFYKTTIVSRRDYGQPFYIEKDGARLIDTWEGGAGMTLPNVIVQGLRAKWQTLETNGTYHHIHSPFGSWPSGIKLTNPSTNTGSLDGVYMGLWTSGVDARLWNYETNGSWNVGVGNVQQATVTTSSFTINSVLTLPPQDPLPTTNVPSASFATSGSGANLKPYFWNGATWTALF